MPKFESKRLTLPLKKASIPCGSHCHHVSGRFSIPLLSPLLRKSPPAIVGPLTVSLAATPAPRLCLPEEEPQTLQNLDINTRNLKEMGINAIRGDGGLWGLRLRCLSPSLSLSMKEPSV
ncbi:hypothetical protein Cni_G02372 [Canna indica]|uniref:Uncharacterized protein n=1 Tax=Canna indica TaxID=4628 RepID=A0AAQ3JQ00_9LILI|nr:hypothetical protein Cni_G02372 [Canna indica]